MASQSRLKRVDEIRGFTLISMILYHFMWDLNHIAMINMDWYTGPFGYVWQKSICITFIFISGFCFSFGKNRLKRSATIFLCGGIITLVTMFFMPENRIIFGILTYIGFAGVITIFIDKLHVFLEKKLNERTLNLTMIIGMLILFIVFFNVNHGYLNVPYRLDMPAYLYKGYVATFIGFPDPTFFSSDYFAILPWTFLYLMGYYTERTVKSLPAAIAFIKQDKLSLMSAIGKKSLIIYMLHQPVLYLITIAIIKVR